MGLDTVELVMQVEETFGIRIDDRDAEKIVTLGKLHTYVMDHLPVTDSEDGRCKSAVAFYRLRRALESSLGIGRDRVRPSSAVDGLLARDGRRMNWRELERALDLRLPGLNRPQWVWEVVFLAGYLCSVSFVLLLGSLPGFPDALAQLSLTCFFLSATVLILIPISTEALAVCIPSSCESVGGLVRAIVIANSGRIAGRTLWSDPAKVWDVLVEVVAEHAGVPRDQLTAATSFVGDLGLD